ncbi:hypothetical protein PO909_000005 [Leuciscus waleckii]
MAGDIEVNPGPTPVVYTIDATEETTETINSSPQYTTIWSLSNRLFDPPLGAVGPVEFPRLGLLRARGPAVASSWFGAGVLLADVAACGDVGGLGGAVSPCVGRSAGFAGLGLSVGSAGIIPVAAHSPERQRCRRDAAGVCTEIPSLLAAVRTLISDKVTESSSNGGESEYEASVALPSPPQPTSPKPTSVLLGNDDSTRVSAHCWETTKAQPTAKGMARTLLLGLFSIDVLLKSNLTGGVNKVDPSAERRQPLDPKKLTALLNAVVQQHPGAKIPDIRTAINKRICELRHQGPVP